MLKQHTDAKTLTDVRCSFLSWSGLVSPQCPYVDTSCPQMDGWESTSHHCQHVMTEEHDWLMGSIKDYSLALKWKKKNQFEWIMSHESVLLFFFTVNTKRTTLETGLIESQGFILRTFLKARMGQLSLITNDRWHIYSPHSDDLWIFFSEI